MSTLMLVNPRKRRKTTAKRRRKSITHAKNPIRRKRRSTAVSTSPRRHLRRKSYRRNPIATSKGVVEQVKGAAVGAMGAVAVDLVMSKLTIIPTAMRTGTMRHVTQGLISVGLGVLVAKVGKNRKLGMQLAEGGLTVALYTMAKASLGDKLGLNGYEELGDDLLGFQDLGDDLLGMDDDFSMGGVGWQNAAPSFDMAGGDFGGEGFLDDN